MGHYLFAKQATLERASEAHTRRDAKLAEAERHVTELIAAHGAISEALESREAELASLRRDVARLSEQLHVRCRPLSRSLPPVGMLMKISCCPFQWAGCLLVGVATRSRM